MNSLIKIVISFSRVLIMSVVRILIKINENRSNAYKILQGLSGNT